MALPRTADPKQTSRFLVMGTVFVVVAAVYFAQDVLIPIALAILLSFLLAPLVRLLERARLPRVVAVLLSVLLAFGVVAGIGFVVYNQLTDLTTRLPGYSQNIKHKAEGVGGMMNWFHHTTAEVKAAVASSTGGGTTKPSTAPSPPGAPASASTDALGTAAGDALSPPPAGAPPRDVQRVEVVNAQSNESSPLTIVETIASDVLGRAGKLFIIIIFTIFMLLQREDLRDRVIRLVGRDRLTTTTEALDDAAGRVSKYLLYQSMVNGSVGLIITGLLWLVGRLAGTPFPSPALWGLLSTLLRFIPYVGIWISAAMPVLLAAAVFPSFEWTLVTLGCYVVTEMVTANAIEPLLFGSSTGIGSLAVLVAAAFWTWLWGPVGLLLSTPLTVCLVVMGKYVPSLEFLSILLSDEPALSPPDRVYQRLLADDHEEAADLIHEYAKTMPLEDLYDTVLLPALATAEGDAQHGGVTHDRRAAIHRGVADVVDELGERLKAKTIHTTADAPGDQGAPAATAQAAAGVGTALTDALGGQRQGHGGRLPAGCVLNVLCLPAHDDTDQLAATMLSQLLEARGYCVTVASPTELVSEMVGSVTAARPDVVVVSALPPAAVAHARYLCKKLQAHSADLSVVVGIWSTPRDLQKLRDRIAGGPAVQLASGLRQAIGQMHEIVQPKLINAALAARAEVTV